MSRFPLVTAAALAVVAVACGPARRAPTTLSNRGPAETLVGDYACRIDEGGYSYPRFRCVVEQRGDRFWLEKVEGSVRLRGWVQRTGGGGLAFDGELYCPMGDCTEQVHTVFASDGAGGYRATVRSTQSGPLTVSLAAAPAGVGGAGYGGDAYGGYGYGGAGYGGAGYGGAGYGGGDEIGPPRDDP